MKLKDFKFKLKDVVTNRHHEGTFWISSAICINNKIYYSIATITNNSKYFQKIDEADLKLQKPHTRSKSIKNFQVGDLLTDGFEVADADNTLILAVKENNYFQLIESGYKVPFKVGDLVKNIKTNGIGTVYYIQSELVTLKDYNGSINAWCKDVELTFANPFNIGDKIQVINDNYKHLKIHKGNEGIIENMNFNEHNNRIFFGEHWIKIDDLRLVENNTVFEIGNKVSSNDLWFNELLVEHKVKYGVITGFQLGNIIIVEIGNERIPMYKNYLFHYVEETPKKVECKFKIGDKVISNNVNFNKLLLEYHSKYGVVDAVVNNKVRVYFTDNKFETFDITDLMLYTENDKIKSNKMDDISNNLDDLMYLNYSQTKLGQKFSSDKVPLFTVLKQFKDAFVEVAKRSQFGHEKYKETDADWRNFVRIDNAEEEYGNALVRHLLEIGEEETEREHLIATAWNSLAKLQVYLENNKT